ncbi:MOSC domain-containing protein [Streptomyces sp. NPDC014870]|uniref:MOSC domain-containing protein n=1 Tax=Streptomyces sp. NPDC014870 TaxID=3364925 RepID=UPI0036FBB35D
MYLREIWRFPVKSMRGEQLKSVELTDNGLTGDRHIHVRDSRGLLTARVRSRLLGLSATTAADGSVLVDGHPWDSPEAGELVRGAAGPDAEAVYYTGRERFDVLNLTVITDGAADALGHDPRRLRSNLVIGGVPGLAERDWPGRTLRMGDAVIGVLKLRSRCVMTTVDPDTGERDHTVLRDIHRLYDGTFALDCWVASPGTVTQGDEVRLTDEEWPEPVRGGWIVGAPYVVA